MNFPFTKKIREFLGRAFKDREIEYIFVGIGVFIILTFIILAVFAPYIAPYNPIEQVGKPLHEPSGKFLFGTNGIGYDVLSRVIYGSGVALRIVFMAVGLSLSVGLALGLLSGYFGGLLDSALSPLMDSLYSFPPLILAIALVAMIGPSIPNIALGVGVVYIPTYYRMVRSHVLSVKEESFVESARALGAKDRTMITKYILPNVVPAIPVVLTLNAADAILTSASLSFLGLGLTAPTPAWGLDLKLGHGYIVSGAWWPSIFPGLMIVLLTLGFSLLGEGLNDILNPETGRRR